MVQGNGVNAGEPGEERVCARAAELLGLLGPTTPASSVESVAAFLAKMTELDQERYLALTRQNVALERNIAQLSEEVAQAAVDERAQQPASREPPSLLDEDIQRLKTRVASQASRVQQLRAQIQRKREDLDRAFQLEMLRSKRNEISMLKKQLQTLVDERELLEKINGDQSAFYRECVSGSVEEGRLRELQKKLRAAKDVSRGLADEKTALERRINAKHSDVVGQGVALRTLLGGSVEAVESASGPTPAQLEAYAAKLAQRCREVEEEHAVELKLLEKAKRDLVVENEGAEQLIKEKQLEIRRNNLRIRDTRNSYIAAMFPRVSTPPGKKHLRNSKPSRNQNQNTANN